MNMRKLPAEEHIRTRRLYEEVFPDDSREFVDYYYAEKIKENEIYVIEEDEDIQAMLHLNPYKMYVNGREQTAHYIVAVATRAAYRKKGYMRELLTVALRDMYRSGETFTYLMPAAESIYLPYDFRTVYEQERRFYTEADEGQKDTVIRALQDEECKELADTANKHLAQHYDVFALRSATYYERMKREYAADGGTLMLYRKEGMITDCRPYVPEQDTDRPVIMIRIVDAERMLMSLSLKRLAAVCFRITDPVIEANNRCVVLTGTEHSGVMLMEGKEENSEGTVDISALGEIVFGACTAEEACRQEGVRMTERMKEELDKIIPLSHIYINEVV